MTVVFIDAEQSPDAQLTGWVKEQSLAGILSWFDFYCSEAERGRSKTREI